MAAPIPPWLGALAGMSVTFVFGDVAWTHRDAIVRTLEPAPATQAAFMAPPESANAGRGQIKTAAMTNHVTWGLPENPAPPTALSSPAYGIGERDASGSSYGRSYAPTTVYVYNYQVAPSQSQSQSQRNKAQPVSGYGPTSLLTPLDHRRLSPGMYGNNVPR